MVNLFKMTPKDGTNEIFEEIYSDFFDTSAKYELNVDFKIKNEINEYHTKKKKLNREMFDEILERIFHTMNDSFMRFSMTKEYQDLSVIKIEERAKEKKRLFHKTKSIEKPKKSNDDSPHLKKSNSFRIEFFHQKIFEKSEKNKETENKNEENEKNKENEENEKKNLENLETKKEKKNFSFSIFRKKK
jgi:hypothetical protein